MRTYTKKKCAPIPNTDYVKQIWLTKLWLLFTYFARSYIPPPNTVETILKTRFDIADRFYILFVLFFGILTLGVEMLLIIAVNKGSLSWHGFSENSEPANGIIECKKCTKRQLATHWIRVHEELTFVMTRGTMGALLTECTVSSELGIATAARGSGVTTETSDMHWMIQASTVSQAFQVAFK